MISRYARWMAGAACVAWAAAVFGQAPPQSQEAKTIPEFAFRYEQSCHGVQAGRLKALPPSASAIQRMEIEAFDDYVCPCLAAKIIEVKDEELAQRILARDPAVQKSFFVPALQQCAVVLTRKLAVASCEDEAKDPQATKVTPQACKCFSEEVAKLSDAAIQDDATKAYSNTEARAKDPSVKPYDSRIVALQTECVRKNP